jgi:alkylated DNA repair dioxygenase AlkB
MRAGSWRGWRRFQLAEPDTQILQRLIAEVPWRSEQVVMWGRKVFQPRLTAWYGDAGSRYAYSGIELNPLPWSPHSRRHQGAHRGCGRFAIQQRPPQLLP